MRAGVFSLLARPEFVFNIGLNLAARPALAAR